MSNKEGKAVAKKFNFKKNKRSIFIILALIIILLLLGLGFCAKSSVSAGELARRLKAEGSDTIVVNGTVKIDEPLTINGDKTIIGNGKIVLTDKLAGEWSDDSSKNNSWGMGCAALSLKETEGMTAILTVSDGATLTMGDSVSVDAAGKANAVHVADGGTLTVDGKATIENGRYANIIAREKATVKLKGGKVQDSKVYGVINYGTLDISGGEHSGSEAVLYNMGTAMQSGGTVAKAKVHNVYVAAGTFTMEGGINESAAKDGVSVQEDATAEIKDGDIKNCVHGLCNNGELAAEEITLSECGIMNYKTGALTLNGTTVDTAAVYCLANNGGNVIAKKFTAKKCDTCAVYNFAGNMELTDLTITGSRDGNIANGGGNLTVNGAMLEKCRDKSIVVANGKAVFNDVTLAGTSREKYGVYVYGGECYMTDGTIYDISSTAFKADTGGYVEAKNITMKDIAQIAFRADGGKIVAEGVTVDTLGSHAIYNMEGDITLIDATIKNVDKNVIQQKGGTTTFKNVEADAIGNHGAYIELGSVTLEESTFKNMEGNGIYLVKGENEATLKNFTLDGTGKQGLNNASKVTIDGLTVKNAAQNGIFNKETGTITVKDVVITSVGEHGINNYNTMTVENAKISNTGKGSNGLQNKGTLTIQEVSVENSKNHGVYNTGTIKGSSLEIKKVAQNGVYNNKDTFDVAKVTVSGAGEHGLNNADKMIVSDVVVNDTGKGKNSVQNSGTLSITTATLNNSKNHGIYNTGKISGKDVTVSNAAQNGVYNAEKGTIDAIKGLVVNGTGSHGINNDAKLVVSNVTISNTGKDKNGIQNAGTATITTASISGSKNHGIYNSGKLSGTDITVIKPGGNGIYNNGGTVDKIVGLTVKNAGDQGVNNNSKFVGSDIKIDGTIKNGVYNNGGTATIDKIVVANTGEHGVSNAGTMTLKNADISIPGAGKNGIQNSGTITTSAVEIDKSQNHGVYNNGIFNAEGKLTVTNADVNGIYNYDGVMTVANAEISATGSHGVNNSGEFEITSLNVANAGDNSIQNSGDMTVKAATLIDSGKHGLYNGKTFYGENISVTNAGDLALSNGGDMEIHGLETVGTANKAIYNSGYAEIYKATIDGTSVDNTSNATAQYLVDNNGGVLDFTDTTIKNAKGTALHNRGKAATSVTNVVIDKAGNYGTFVEGGSSLSGDGLEINNITKGIEGAEGMPIKNAGKITMLDHVTLGSDDPEVTGSGTTISETFGNIVNNAIVNDATTASYSGYDLVVSNATAGCAFYNKGILYIKDFASNNAKDGIVSRYSGWATLSGSMNLTNTIRNPFTTYGPESNNYNNGITVASGSNVLVDGAGSHAINNKGSFLAAADTNISINNVTGTNINAINNNGGRLSLGNAKIQNMFVDITWNTNEDKINTNSGTALMLSGPATIDGKVEISNIYTKPAAIPSGSNAQTNLDNTNGSGVVVRKSGSNITGNGSISITAGSAVEGYRSVHNGIFTDGRPVELAGDVTINGAANQGIYVANANASVKAANVTLTNIDSGHGVYVNNATGKFEATGSVTTNVTQRGLYTLGTMKVTGNVSVTGAKNHGIEIDGTGNNNGSLTVGGNITVNGTGSGTQGINANGAKAKLQAANITINNAGGNGLWLNDASGSVKATETIKIVSPAKGRGIGNYGTVEAANIEVSGVTSYAGIENSKTITVTGNVKVENITNGPGLRNMGTMTVNGTTTIQNISGTKTNGIQQDGGKTLNLNNLIITNISSTVAGENYCNGIHNKGTINLSGTATISNIENVAVTKENEGCGIVNAEAGRTIKGAGSIVVSNVQRNGIYNNGGTIDVASVTVMNVANMGIFMENAATIKATTVNVDRTASQAIQLNHANTINVGTMTITNSAKNGLRLYNNNANPTITIGTLIIKNCTEYGLAAQKALTSDNLSVTTLQWFNCGKGAVHGNIKSGVGTVEKLTQ